MLTPLGKFSQQPQETMCLCSHFTDEALKSGAAKWPAIVTQQMSSQTGLISKQGPQAAPTWGHQLIHPSQGQALPPSTH